jgi:PEP-CTERM motif
MKLRIIVIFATAALLSLLSGVSAKADTFTLTWIDQNSPSIPSSFPFTQDGGTDFFTIPAGQEIVGAVFSATFGDTFANDTALIDVDVNGVQVGACTSMTDQCFYSFLGPTPKSPTPFGYTYTSADLVTLGTGMADLTVTQLSPSYIRLGSPTLVITTAPITAAPEPGSLALLGFGVLGIAAVKFSKR